MQALIIQSLALVIYISLSFVQKNKAPYLIGLVAGFITLFLSLFLWIALGRPTEQTLVLTSVLGPVLEEGVRTAALVVGSRAVTNRSAVGWTVQFGVGFGMIDATRAWLRFADVSVSLGELALATVSFSLIVLLHVALTAIAWSVMRSNGNGWWIAFVCTTITHGAYNFYILNVAQYLHGVESWVETAVRAGVLVVVTAVALRWAKRD